MQSTKAKMRFNEFVTWFMPSLSNFYFAVFSVV